MADIDARVAEVLRVKFADLNYFGDATPSGYHLKDFQTMMRRSGTGGMVLLKNEGGLLPLARTQSVALIGPFAADKELTVGNQGSSTVYPSYAVTLKAALEAQHVRVNYAQGCAPVVCVGVDPGRMQGENRDRPTYALPAWQDELVEAVREVNPKTVVVLFTAGGCDVSPWIDQVPAVVEAFHPGSEGGNIVSDVLFGDVNPSGKLTITWPLHQEDLPYTGAESHYRDTACEFGYRYFDAAKKPVRFPFGYRLSYTTFAYENLTVKKSADARYPVAAKVTLKNTGDRAGREVVQVYASEADGAVGEPVKKLAGYLKVELAPDETKTVEVPLYWLAFQYYDVGGKAWKPEPGGFVVRAGPSSWSLPLEATFSP